MTLIDAAVNAVQPEAVRDLMEAGAKLSVFSTSLRQTIIISSSIIELFVCMHIICTAIKLGSAISSTN
jgi:hypothetical protein